MRKKQVSALAPSIILPLTLSALSLPAAGAGDCFDLLGGAREKDHLYGLCEAARAGDPGAMYWLGLAYIEGVLVNDYDKGVRWLKKASFAGNKEASRLYEFISSAEIGPGC